MTDQNPAEEDKEYHTIRQEILDIRQKEKKLGLSGKTLSPAELTRLQALEKQLITLGQQYIRKVREFLKYPSSQNQQS